MVWPELGRAAPLLGLALVLSLGSCRGAADSKKSRATKAPLDAGAIATGPAPDARVPSGPTLGIWLQQVETELLAWPPDLSPPGPQVDEMVAEVAQGFSQVLPRAAPTPDSVPAKLKVAFAVEVAHAPAGRTVVQAAVEARLSFRTPEGVRAIFARVIGQSQPLGKRALLDVVKDTLRRAVGDALAPLAAREEIRRGDATAVLRALDAADPDVRSEAYRAVAERQLRQAVPRLLELIKNEDPLIRDAAIGALVALREESAVKPMVNMVPFSDIDMMRRIVDAVGEIGGEEARTYLEFVAEGHENRGVRQLAQEALERLLRRGGGDKP